MLVFTGINTALEGQQWDDLQQSGVTGGGIFPPLSSHFWVGSVSRLQTLQKLHSCVIVYGTIFDYNTVLEQQQVSQVRLWCPLMICVAFQKHDDLVGFVSAALHGCNHVTVTLPHNHNFLFKSCFKCFKVFWLELCCLEPVWTNMNRCLYSTAVGNSSFHLMVVIFLCAGKSPSLSKHNIFPPIKCQQTVRELVFVMWCEWTELHMESLSVVLYFISSLSLCVSVKPLI